MRRPVRSPSGESRQCAPDGLSDDLEIRPAFSSPGSVALFLVSSAEKYDKNHSSSLSRQKNKTTDFTDFLKILFRGRSSDT